MVFRSTASTPLRDLGWCGVWLELSEGGHEVVEARVAARYRIAINTAKVSRRPQDFLRRTSDPLPNLCPDLYWYVFVAENS